MKATMPARTAAELPRVTAGVLRVFTAYTCGYVRRHFHGFHILKRGLPPPDCTRPLVIYLNHASWWDPLVCLLLAREFFPHHTSFAPIDAAMLERYRFFRHLGFFGIEQNTSRGARTFLWTTHAILASSRHAVWLTPQGRFMDVRKRPLRLQEGLGVLAAREGNATFLPLAIEYAFWTEPRAEILVSFGEPIIPINGPAHTAAEWTQVFSDALESSQDELAACSCRRDPVEWLTLNRGRSGVAPLYDVWRWLCARVRGEKFTPEHHADMTR